ncbi:ABC transporter permease [Rhizobium leguminosarum]|uniref:ABC transporter permease n=1 Tax=Rhizobium leguminosarum TaxID=384 RepID=UPI003D068C03
MNVSVVVEALTTLPAGLILTASLTISSLFLSFFISVPLALLRASANSAVSATVLVYTYVFRGTPLLVQLFIIYYGVGQIPFIRQGFLWPVLREPFWCAMVAFTLNSTAHTTEVFRGGIQAIPRGLNEAAKSLGLSRTQTFGLITFPLMMRISLPAYTNEVIGMLKASSLASTITLLEITGLARKLVSATFAPYEVFLVAGALYLALTYAIANLSARLERRWNRKMIPADAGAAIAPSIASSPVDLPLQ